MNIKLIPVVMATLIISACSSQRENYKLLPDGGPTTAELISNSTNNTHSYFGGESVPYVGKPIMGGYQPNSIYSTDHIQELKRDFQQVPNPEIVGYVYPHLNNNKMPIPGYFTIFKLYKRDHFALTSEGYRE